MNTEINRIKSVLSNAKDKMRNNEYKAILKWDGEDLNSFYRLIEDVIKKQIRITYSLSGMLDLPGFSDYPVKLIHIRVKTKKNALYLKQILKSLYYDLVSSEVIGAAQEVSCKDEGTFIVAYLYKDINGYNYDNILFSVAVTLDDRITNSVYGVSQEIKNSKEEILTFTALRDFSLYQDIGALSTEEYFRDMNYVDEYLNQFKNNIDYSAFMNKNGKIKRAVKRLKKQAFNLTEEDASFMSSNKLTNSRIANKCIKVLESIQGLCMAQGGE